MRYIFQKNIKNIIYFFSTGVVLLILVLFINLGLSGIIKLLSKRQGK